MDSIAAFGGNEIRSQVSLYYVLEFTELLKQNTSRIGMVKYRLRQKRCGVDIHFDIKIFRGDSAENWKGEPANAINSRGKKR